MKFDMDDLKEVERQVKGANVNVQDQWQYLVLWLQAGRAREQVAESQKLVAESHRQVEQSRRLAIWTIVMALAVGVASLAQVATLVWVLLK